MNSELWIGWALQAVLSTIRALRVNADGAAIGKATLEQSRASVLMSVDDSDQYHVARYEGIALFNRPQ